MLGLAMIAYVARLNICQILMRLMSIENFEILFWNFLCGSVKKHELYLSTLFQTLSKCLSCPDRITADMYVVTLSAGKFLIVQGQETSTLVPNQIKEQKTPVYLTWLKGQLISKGHFGVFKSTKNQRNFCKDFCPSLKKEVE